MQEWILMNCCHSHREVRKQVLIGFGFAICFSILLLFPRTSQSHQLRKPPHAVDRLLLLRNAEDFASGSFENCRLVSDGTPGVQLRVKSDGTFPERGVYTSPEFTSDFPFNELVPSWNVDTPEGTGFAVRFRVSNDGKEWSTWYFLGRYGKTPDRVQRVLRDSFGRVDADYLMTQKPCAHFQYKVTFYSDGTNAPRLRLMAINYTNSLKDQALHERFRQPEKQLDPESWIKDLPVRFRSQLWEDPKVRWSVCGPTSLSMVLEYYGINRSTKEIYEKCRDIDLRIFGVWPRHVQVAAEYGLIGWLQRFRTWDDVKEQIALGRPVIISAKYKKGVLSNAPVEVSSGHILVIRGFDKDGHVLVNDPVGATEEKGAVTYNQDELAAAWLDEGGVGYVFTRP